MGKIYKIDGVMKTGGNVKGGKFSNGQLLLPLFNVKQGVVLGDILCKDMLMLRV